MFILFSTGITTLKFKQGEFRVDAIGRVPNDVGRGTGFVVMSENEGARIGSFSQISDVRCDAIQSCRSPPICGQREISICFSASSLCSASHGHSNSASC